VALIQHCSFSSLKAHAPNVPLCLVFCQLASMSQDSAKRRSESGAALAEFGSMLFTGVTVKRDAAGFFLQTAVQLIPTFGLPVGKKLASLSFFAFVSWAGVCGSVCVCVRERSSEVSPRPFSQKCQ